MTLQSNNSLYLSAVKASAAVQSKSELDCLAFAIMGKLLFGCSVMVKSTARQYKYMFRMGTARFNRIFRDCLNRGYITDCGNHYIFVPIKAQKAQNMVVELPNAWGRNKDKRSAITLNQAKDYIRKVAQYDKFAKKAVVENVSTTMANPKSRKAYRRAQKISKRISHNAFFDGLRRGTSMSRVARNMNTYKAKARKLVREMVSDGWITNKPVTIKTDFAESQFTPQALIMLNREYGWCGSYFHLGHDIFCRVANIYELNDVSKLRFLNTK